jgi:DNA replication protein DnaC
MTEPETTHKNTPQPVCPLCQGLGWVSVNVPVGHRLFGKAVPCQCQRARQHERRLGNLRSTSNLQHLQRMTFDSFVTDRHDAVEVTFSLGYALETAREFAQNPLGWLLLQGPYGCGKTHLAVAIANDRVARGQPALFVVVPDLLDHLRATYGPSSPVSYDERFEQVRNVELLILDDLGTQNATSWAAEKLYQILNYRYNAELPTVITTNQRIDDMDPRLVSRLKDQHLVKPIPIYAPDYRITAVDSSFGSLDPYRAMTFETFSTRRGEIEPAQSSLLARLVQALQEYAASHSNWIVLRGPYGVGKTHLAAAVANRITSSGKAALFVVVSDLLDHLRATFGPSAPVSYDKRFQEVRESMFLVLDDLGAQNSTNWAQEKLFQLLNHRYVRRLPTILTVAEPAWHELDERLLSRLQDRSVCTIIDIEVPAFRGDSPPKQAPRRSTRRRM